MSRKIELTPSCDLWMRGARFGTIVKTRAGADGQLQYGIRMDHPEVKKIVWFTKDRIKII